MGNTARQGRRPNARRRRGAVLVVVLVSMTMLIGMLFFVVNLGDQVNRRVEIQSAADAVAISGAGWLSRSMNVIAMNNVAQAKLISLVPVYDSIPLAAEIAMKDLNSGTGLYECIQSQLLSDYFAGRTETLYANNGGGAPEPWFFLREGLARLAIEMIPSSPSAREENQFDRLRRLDESFDSDDEQTSEGGYEIGRLTHWDRGLDHGMLWEGALALRELSQACLDTAATLSQANADRFGYRSNAKLSFLVPLEPRVPGTVTEFSDFHEPLLARLNVYTNRAQQSMPVHGIVNTINRLDARLVQIQRRASQIERQLGRLNENQANLAENLENQKNRLLDEVRRIEQDKERRFTRMHYDCPGGGIPDMEYPHRLGPYARLYKWRHPIQGGGRGRASIGGGGSDPEFRQDRIYYGDVTERYQVGYYAYGPYRWAMDHVAWGFGTPGRHHGILDTTRFVHFHAWVSNIKLAYVFGLNANQRIRYPTEWISDYEEAKEFAEDPENAYRVLRTRWYRIRVASSVPWNDDEWMRDAKTYWSWDQVYLPNQRPPNRWIWEHQGWWDVENNYLSRRDIQARGEHDRLGTSTWRWRRQDQVDFDRRIGLEPIKDADDNFVQQDRYMVSWYIFGGLQIGDVAVVANPMDWPGDEDYLPAPVLLDVETAEYDEDHDAGGRRESMTYLGVAQRPSPARVWPARFSSGNPTQAVLGLAQAEIFNNTSWDLWTQDWQRQLVPVSGWEDWMEVFGNGVSGDVREYDLDDQKVAEAYEYLNALRPSLAERFLNH